MLQETIADGQEEYVIGKLGEERAKKLSLTELLERRFFTAFSVILEELRFPLPLACFEIIASFLQVFGFVFEEADVEEGLDQFRGDVTGVLNNFRFYKAVEVRDNNSSLYFVVAYGLFLVQIVYAALMGFVVKYSDSGKKRFGSLVQLACFLTPTIYWVLLNPTTEFFASIFHCDLTTGYHLSISGMRCWTTSHYIHISLFCVFFVVFLVNLLLICLLGNDSNPYHEHNPFRRFLWNFELLFAGYRLVFSTLCVLIMTTTVDWILDAIFLALALLFLLYMRRAMFYDRVVCRVFGACLLAAVWVFLNELIFEIAKACGVTYCGRTITTLLGLAFMYSLANKIQTHYVTTLIEEKNSVTLDNDRDVELFLHRIIELERGNDRSTLSQEDSTFLLGYIFLHKSECLKPECPMNAADAFYIPLTKQYSYKENKVFDDHVRIKHMVQKIYRDKMRSESSRYTLSDSSEVRVSSIGLLLASAYYQIYVMGNFYIASCQLDKAETGTESIAARGAILKAKRTIEAHQEELNQKKNVQDNVKSESPDFRQVFEYEAHFGRLKHKLFLAAELQKKFCAELLLPTPDLNVVHLYGLKLIENCEDAASAWSQLKDMDCVDVRAEVLYALYLTNVRSKQSEANEHLRTAKSLGEKPADSKGLDLAQNRQVLFAEDSATIVMGTAGDFNHKIIRASNGITHIFEYSPADLVGKDITALMPSFIGEEHLGLVQNSLRTGQYSVVNKVIENFGVDKEQYLFGLHMCVKQYYDLIYGVIFVGLMRPTSKDEATIITDMSGKILGISYDVYEMLHELTPTLLREQDVYLFYICPDFYQELEGREYSEFSDSVALTFCVPKNLQAVSQSIDTEQALILSKLREGNPERTEKLVSTEDVFKKSYIAAFKYEQKGTVKRWCTVRSKSFGGGKVKFKVISFGKLEVKNQGEHGDSPDTAVIEQTICTDPHRFDVQRMRMDLRSAQVSSKSIVDPNIEPDSPVANTGSGKLRDILNSSSDMKRVLFYLYRVAMRSRDESGRGAARREEAKRASSRSPAESPRNTGGPAEPPKDLEASASVDMTRRCLVATQKKVESPEARRNPKRKAEDKSAPEDEDKEEADADKAPSQSVLEKEIGNMHSSACRGYLPRSLSYANLGVTAFLVLSLALSIAQFVIYEDTLSEMESLGQMTKWARTRYIIATYEAVRSMSMMIPTTDGKPLLNVSARSDYDYGTIGYENEDPMNYSTWKLRDMYEFTKDFASIEAKIQIHYIGVSSKQEAEPNDVNWTFYASDGTTYKRTVMMHSMVEMLLDEAMTIYSKISLKRTDISGNAALFLANVGSVILNASQSPLADSLDIIGPTITREKLVSLILLCVMFSTAGVCALGFIPLLHSIRKDTSRMLQLLVRTKPRSLKAQIDNCAKFTSFLHFEGGPGDNREEGEREEDEEEEGEQQNEDEGHSEADALVAKDQHRSRRKNRKAFVEFQGSFVTRVLEIFFAFGVISCYSLYCYYKPPAFFDKVDAHLKEISTMQTVMSYDYLSYAMTMDMFASNGTVNGNSERMVTLITTLRNRSMETRGSFIENHKDRQGYFTSAYNTDFESLLLDSGCQAGVVSNLTECATIMDTVLAKGVIFANDALMNGGYEICADYLKTTARTLDYTRSVLNGRKVIEAEKVFRKYIMPVLEYMSDSGISSLSSALDSEWPWAVGTFVAFVAVITAMYLLLWRLYMGVLKQDLFSSKLLFSYLPLELIVENRKLAACVLEYVRDLTAAIQR